MTIRVELQPQVFQTNLDNLISGSSSAIVGDFKGVPKGKFTNIAGPITQFSTTLDTGFRITTDSPGIPHTIRATLINNDTNQILSVRNRIVERQFIPVNTQVTVSIPLLKGENQIDVFNENDATFTSVIATHFGTFLTTYAREIFSSTQNPLDEQDRALFSLFSSRMTEILIPFQDLYADPKSLRTLISRFVTRAYVTKNGTTEGVRDFAAAILGTTPIFVPTQTDQNQFEPDVVPIFRSQLEFGGFEAHAWIPNYEITHWLAFIKLIDSARDFFTIQEIGESEVLILANGEPEIHRFNFDDPSATAYSEFNFTEFRAVVEILNQLNIRFCAAGYPFDLFVTTDNPLGQKRLTFDSIIAFDSGEPLDAPDIDPGAEGFVGLTLSGRFENYALNENPIALALDSMFITPSPASGLDECVYGGFFSQTVHTYSQYLDVDATDVDVTGNINDENDFESIDEFRVDTEISDFSDLAEFSISGTSPGSIALDTSVALLGTSAIKHTVAAGGGPATISWNPAIPVDLTLLGADILYLSVFFGLNALGIEDLIQGIPAHPGNLQALTISLIDGSNNSQSHVFNKEDLQFGPNTLPIILDFPGIVSSSALDRSDIVRIEFQLDGISGHTGWDDIYLGGLYKLDEQAAFRPARAKVELLDINDISPQDLYGSELRFVDQQGNPCTITADQTYNNFEENAYIPKRYKIELQAGVGTEGFDRPSTANNLREEIGRQLALSSYSQVMDRLSSNGEIFVDIFSKQFSPSGSSNLLSLFNPNLDEFGNPVNSLLSVTSFAGGSVGVHSKLAESTGPAIAQQFTLSGTETVRFLELFIHRIGMPLGNVRAAIHENRVLAAGDEPGTRIERTAGKLAVGINASAPDYTIFPMSDPLTLNAGTYWIVLAGDPTYNSSADLDNHIIWGKKQGVFAKRSSVLNPNFGVVNGSLWFKDNALLENFYYKVIG